MDASCKIQGSIHVFRLVNNMCPGKWVHIILWLAFLFYKFYTPIYPLFGSEGKYNILQRAN